MFKIDVRVNIKNISRFPDISSKCIKVHQGDIVNTELNITNIGEDTIGNLLLNTNVPDSFEHVGFLSRCTYRLNGEYRNIPLKDMGDDFFFIHGIRPGETATVTEQIRYIRNQNVLFLELNGLDCDLFLRMKINNGPEHDIMIKRGFLDFLFPN